MIKKVLALLLTLSVLGLSMPAKVWAPSIVNPAGGATAPVSQTSTTTGFGKTWYTGNAGAPVVAYFLDDVNLLGFHPPSATQMNIYQSSNGGRTYSLARSITPFAAGTFGQLLQLAGPSASGRVFFVMLSSNGGMSYATNVSGTAGTGWVLGPAGGGTQDGITVAVGPNGTVVYMRESGGVGQTCRSVDDGTTWTCTTFIAASSQGVSGTMVSPSAGIWMFANNGQMWRSVDDGQSFVSTFTPANGIQGISCLTPTVCLIAAGGLTAGTVYRSTDAGVSWTLTATFTTLWQTSLWGGAGIANYGGGVVDIIGSITTTTDSPGYRSTDFGLTWSPLPVYNVVPGGTGVRGITGMAVRSGRAVAFQWTSTSVNTQLFSPLQGSGATTVTDDQGNQLKSGAGCAGNALNLTTFTNISVTANTQLITGAGTFISICHVDLVTAGAENISLVEGTGATCGTGTAGLFGGATAATGWNLAANGQVNMGTGRDVLRRTATSGDNICILKSGAGQVSGLITWTQE